MTPLTVAHPTTEKHGEPALLAVVEAFIERLGGAGELSEISGAGAQTFGRARKTVDRIDILGLVFTPFALVAPGGETFGPLLGKIAHGRFERGPILFLFGIQFEAGFQRGDARVKEGGSILGAKASVLSPCAESSAAAKAPAGERGEHKRGRHCE